MLLGNESQTKIEYCNTKCRGYVGRTNQLQLRKH